MIDFTVRLAGIRIGIRAAYAESRNRMRDYLVDGAEPDLTVAVTEDDRRETLRRLRVCNGDAVSCTESYLEFLAIHSAIADALLDYDIMLMHGSCLSLDGEGYLFTAKSGTGKSTHSRLWREVYGSRVVMVNDDKPLLKCGENEIIAYGSPWNGKEHRGENTCVRLRAIAYLERAEENSITPVRPEDVFHLLYIQTYHSAAPARAARAMQLLNRISRSVAMYRLRVNMDPEAAVIACEGMRGELGVQGIEGPCTAP